MSFHVKRTAQKPSERHCRHPICLMPDTLLILSSRPIQQRYPRASAARRTHGKYQSWKPTGNRSAAHGILWRYFASAINRFGATRVIRGEWRHGMAAYPSDGAAVFLRVKEKIPSAFSWETPSDYTSTGSPREDICRTHAMVYTHTQTHT